MHLIFDLIIMVYAGLDCYFCYQIGYHRGTYEQRQKAAALFEALSNRIGDIIMRHQPPSDPNRPTYLDRQ